MFPTMAKLDHHTRAKQTNIRFGPGVGSHGSVLIIIEY